MNLMTKLFPAHAAVAAELEQAGFGNAAEPTQSGFENIHGLPPAQSDPSYQSDLSLLQSSIHAWQVPTFPTQSVASKFAHLRRELEEILKAPDDIVEWADVLNLFLGSAALAGIPADQIVKAGFVKLAICKNRQWCAPDSEGVCQHKL